MRSESSWRLGRREWTIKCNWKVFVDNYLDGGYHIPFLHKGLSSILSFKDYTVDWTAWLAGDTIATSNWSVPTGLTQTSASSSTAAATIWLSGGTVPNDYEVHNTITTAGGRTDRAMLKIQVR